MIKPTYRYKRTIDITPAFLLEQELRGIIVDVDNTLCPYGAREIPADAKQWIEKMSDARIAVCLVSNGGQGRISGIAHETGIPYLARAGKPAKAGYVEAARLMGIPLETTAVIGDQLFTDIWGAQRLNLISILVEPIDRTREAFVVKIKRPFEKLFLSKIPFDG